MFATLFRVFRAQRPLCALDGETVVAVAGIAPAGTCQATALQRFRFLPTMIAIGPGAASRLSDWLAAWAEHDPDQPHSHLGPVAVEPPLQGHGLGGQLMREYCRRLDLAGEVSYLETDKRENVPFYERHGYAVIDEADVIGVPNWFMIRQPQPSV
jgi:GNAT superfamily N-acetyltransferase